jgi:hypothetical protein
MSGAGVAVTIVSPVLNAASKFVQPTTPVKDVMVP